jgi:zinc protease
MKYFKKFPLFIVIIHFIFLTVILCAADDAVLSDPDRLVYPPLSFQPPHAERIVLDNGLIFYILENTEIPLLKITAVVRTGNMYDPLGKEGLAELTATVMRTGGIAGMTGNNVDEALDYIAASLRISINRDSGVFTLSVLKKDLNEGMDIFSRILMQPAFEEKKLAQAKELKIGALRRIADDPQKLAFQQFGRLMHEGSPRGSLATVSSINFIQRDDLLRFHDRFYHPERVMISVSGDIDRGVAETFMKRYFGTWMRSDETVDEPSLPHPQEGGIFLLSKQVPQSVVIFGWLAPSKKDPQFYPSEVLDFIVGSGGFRSRIFQEIRTNQGLAYSTGSFYTANREYGLFGTYALTKSESTVKVISLLRHILEDVGKKNVLPKDLERAKKSIQNSFIFSFASADQIAFQQLMIEYDHLNLDYLKTYRDKIENVKADDIMKVARCHFNPGKAIILVVGNEAACNQISQTFENTVKIEGIIEMSYPAASSVISSEVMFHSP